jgi:hypothetical protein
MIIMVAAKMIHPTQPVGSRRALPGTDAAERLPRPADELVSVIELSPS